MMIRVRPSSGSCCHVVHNAGRAAGRQVTRNHKVWTLIVRIVSFCGGGCSQDYFVLRDLGHVTKSLCVWSSHLSKGSMMSFPPTLKSCRKDQKKIRGLKSINGYK